MRSLSLFLPSLFAVSVSASFHAPGTGSHSHLEARSRHAALAKRLQTEEEEAREVVLRREVEMGINGTELEEGGLHRLGKRGGYSGRATFFAPGQGACGGPPDSSSDYIVALNEAQYGSLNDVSKYCFKEITIQYGSKTQNAKITDACPGCPEGGLDMSPGLFDAFANPSVGVFYMSWWFADGSSGSGGGSDEEQHTTSKSSSQWHPSTTSYWHAPTTSSSSQWVAPTTSNSPSPSSSSASSTPSSSSADGQRGAANSTTSAADPETTGTGMEAQLSEDAMWELEGGNLDRVNHLVMALGNLVGQVAAKGGNSTA